MFRYKEINLDEKHSIFGERDSIEEDSIYVAKRNSKNQTMMANTLHYELSKKRGFTCQRKTVSAVDI